MHVELNPIFTERQAEFFKNEMCINVQEFELDLHQKFGRDAIKFRNIVDFFLSYPEKDAFRLHRYNESIVHENKLKKLLKVYLVDNDIEIKFEKDDDIDFYCYDLRWYFICYWGGGLKELFIWRQPTFNGPRIYLDRRLSTEAELSSLSENITAYRGMARKEYDSNELGMSWSLSLDVATGFAERSEEENTVVVKSMIRKQDVLLYEKNPEEEIVVKDKTITEGEIVWESNKPLV